MRFVLAPRLFINCIHTVQDEFDSYKSYKTRSITAMQLSKINSGQL